MARTYASMTVKELGSVERVAHESVALPKGHIRVAVKAAGINFADALIIMGQYQEKPKLPFTPGGVVVESSSPRFAAGDAVFACTMTGAWAEEVVVPAHCAFRYPSHWSCVQAASFPIAYGTAHVALQKARVSAQDVVLVTGASGGTGSAAVGIARAFGARVIATARGESKARFCRDVLKADVVVDLLEEDLVKAVMKYTDGKGVNVVYETVGDAIMSTVLKCIKWGGRVLVVGFAGGKIPKIPANLLLVKNTDVMGVYWGAHLVHQPKVFQESFEELLRWAEEGKLQVHPVDHQFRLEDVRLAIQALQKHEIIGKAVLLTRNYQQSRL